MSNSEVIAVRPGPGSSTTDGTISGGLVVTVALRGFEVGESVLVQSMVTQQHPDDVEPAQQAFADSAAQVRLGTTDVVPDAAGMHFEIEIPATIRDGGAFLIAEQISVVSQVSYAWQSLLAPTGANSSPTVTPAAGWIKKAADSADDADS